MTSRHICCSPSVRDCTLTVCDSFRRTSKQADFEPTPRGNPRDYQAHSLKPGRSELALGTIAPEFRTTSQAFQGDVTAASARARAQPKAGAKTSQLPTHNIITGEDRQTKRKICAFFGVYLKNLSRELGQRRSGNRTRALKNSSRNQLRMRSAMLSVIQPQTSLLAMSVSCAKPPVRSL